MATIPIERPRAEPDQLSLEAHRRLIGYLGFVLPWGLFAIAGLRPTEGLPRWSFLSSVSAYYYSGAVALFVGVLFALSLSLWTYRGYKDEEADRVVGGTSGTAAACVALFPTAAPTKGLAPAWWYPWVGYVHHVAAMVLFVSFIVFAIWLFRMTAVMQRDERPAPKKRRDAICLGCGIVMIGAVVWAAVAGLAHRPIFWPEVIAIEAFAVSWLTKGEAHKPYGRAMRSVRSRFARQPQ